MQKHSAITEIRMNQIKNVKTVGRIVFCRGNRDDSSDSFFALSTIFKMNFYE